MPTLALAYLAEGQRQRRIEQRVVPLAPAVGCEQLCQGRHYAVRRLGGGAEMKLKPALHMLPYGPAPPAVPVIIKANFIHNFTGIPVFHI